MNPKNLFRITAVLVVIAALSACNGSGNNDPVDPPGAYKLSYGDSILYLRPSGNNIVYPTEYRSGRYTGFPEGIEIDENTGAINIANSESGLRYRITHTAPDGTKTEIKVVISGITFTDKFYMINTGDSVAPPVYNASGDRILPLTGSNFDEGNLANGGGCSVRTDNGKINLAESIRNGLFGGPPRNDDTKEVEIKYRINDGSNKSLNKLKVKLYWYNTMADVPQYLWDILNDRATQGVFLRGGSTGGTEFTTALAKPRPPCIIIVGQ